MSRAIFYPSVDMSGEVKLFEDVDFEVGDEVIFECSDMFTNRPRWQFNDDTGGNDVWAQGKVVHVDEDVIRVDFTIEGFFGTGHCAWPNAGHEEYDALQWWQNGYLQKVLVNNPKCECGAETTYGPSSPHSDWCPKFK